MKFTDGIPYPEFVDANELLAEQKLSRIAFSAAYQEKVHQFRSDVTRLMMKHNALHEGGSWLIFDHTEDKQEGPILLAPRIDICVATKTVPDYTGKNKFGNQSIRIMLNEAYICEKGIEYFVIDSIVDQDGDSQYNIGVMPADPANNGENVTVPIFFVADEELSLYSPVRHLVYPEIQYLDEFTIPFGHFTNTEDKFHALNIAYGLLNTVIDRVPLHSTKND
jgi:hypothetical protein